MTTETPKQLRGLVAGTTVYVTLLAVFGYIEGSSAGRAVVAAVISGALWALWMAAWLFTRTRRERH